MTQPLPKRNSIPAHQLQAGMNVFMHVPRWNGSYDIHIDEVVKKDKTVLIKVGQYGFAVDANEPAFL